MKKLFTTMVLMLLGIAGVSAQFTVNDIIYKAPEGEVKSYTRNAYCFMNMEEGYWGQNDYGAKVNIVFCENGDVYIPDMIAYKKHGAYLKGKLEGNKIVMEFPQPVMRENDGTISVAQRMIYAKPVGGDPTMIPDPEHQTVTFTIDESGVIEMEGTYAATTQEVVMIGMTTADGKWNFYGDTRVVFTPFEDYADQVITAPEGLEFETDWSFSFTTDTDASRGHDVQIAFDGRDVYIKGLYERLPDSCIVGDYDEELGIIIFPGVNYLGYDEFKGYHIYLMAATVDEDDIPMFIDDITIFVDEKREVMQGVSQFFAVNYGKEAMRVLEYWLFPSFRKSTAPAQYKRPLPPTNIVYSPYGGAEGENLKYGALKFDFQTLDENFNVLEPEWLSYMVFFDDREEPITFTSPTYRSCAKPMTFVPYGFDDSATYYDFLADGKSHTFFFYDPEVEFIGVATRFDAPDGNTYASDITWMDGTHTENTWSGIRPVEILNGEVVATEYFDLTGMKVANPTSGLYIKRDRLSNGSYRATKILIRK